VRTIQSEIESGVVCRVRVLSSRPDVILTAGALAAPLAPIAAALVLCAARSHSPDSGRVGSGRLSAVDSSFDGGAGTTDRLLADV